MLLRKVEAIAQDTGTKTLITLVRRNAVAVGA